MKSKESTARALKHALALSFLILFSPAGILAAEEIGDHAGDNDQRDTIAGYWQGRLALGPMNLRMALAVTENDDGSISAELISLDQNSASKNAESLTFVDRELQFQISQIQAHYQGTLSENGSEIAGTFTQGPEAMPLTFVRAKKAVTTPGRPQEPEAPYPYDSEDVSFQNAVDGTSLAGTLTIPHGNGPFPSVVLVSGSGPQDRNNAVMGHKPFLVLADRLARRGIASLRFDDRGVGKSEGRHLDSEISDFSEDAKAGIRFLSSRPKIKASSTGLIGHSEGGLIGSIIAAQKDFKELSFLVLLAAPGESFFDVQIWQSRRTMKLAGASDALIDRFLAQFDKHFERVMDPAVSGREIRRAIEEEMAQFIPSFSEKELRLLEYNKALYDSNMRVMSTPWYRSVIKETPLEYLHQVTIPTLVMFGQLDQQLDHDTNFQLIRDALEDAGNQDFDVVVYPQLNHFFQHAKTGEMREYNEIEETMSPEVLEDICNWIGRRF